MAVSGVNAVFAVSTKFIADLLTRNLSCTSISFNASDIELSSPESNGTVLFKWPSSTATPVLELRLSAEIVQGQLRVDIDVITAPDFVTSMIAGMFPFYYDLDGILPESLHVVRCGLKAGGAGDLLILGAEVAEGSQCDWDYFHTVYSGTDVVNETYDWGAFVCREVVEAVIWKLSSDALASGQADQSIRNLEIWHIEWPGDLIRLKGVLTTDRECWWGTQDFDFRWTAELTFPVEESKVFAKLKVAEVTSRGAEDDLNAIACTLGWYDFVPGIFILHIQLVLGIWAIKGSLISGDGQEITKELIDLAFPPTGVQCANKARATSDGVWIYGRFGESGSSNLVVPKSLDLEQDIKQPFCSGRPSESVSGSLVVENTGSASLILCGVEATDHCPAGQSPACHFVVSENLVRSLPLGILPGRSLNLPVTACPGLAEYDHEYQGTLVLDTLATSIDSYQNATYSWAHPSISLTAKFSCHPYGGIVVDTPEYAIVYGPEQLWINAQLEKPIIDFIDRMPWDQIELPQGSVEVIDIVTMDPAVGSMQVGTADGQTVATIEAGLRGGYISLVLNNATQYTLMATPAGFGTATGDIRARVICTKTALSKEGTVKFAYPITRAILAGRRLMVAAGQNLTVFDVSDPANAPRILSKNMGSDIDAFDIGGGFRTRSGGHLAVCLGDNRLSLFDLPPASTGKTVLTPIGKSMLGQHNTSNVRCARGRCIAIGPEGLTLLDMRDPARVRILSELQLNKQVHDAIASDRLLFVGMDWGIETFDLRDPRSPVLVDMFPTDSPVIDLRLKGPILYATQQKGSTILLSCCSAGALRPIGRYSQPFWKVSCPMEANVALSIGDDGKRITLYRVQGVKVDMSRIRPIPS